MEGSHIAASSETNELTPSGLGSDPRAWWLAAAAIVNDIVTVLTFVWWGIAGQLPMNFALAGAVLLGTSITFIWLSPCKVMTAIGWFAGIMLGLLLGDSLLGLPLNGPIPAQPNLHFQRMLGPIIGSSFGASTVILFWYAHSYVCGSADNQDDA